MRARLLALTLAGSLAAAGCGTFTPPDEGSRSEDLLALARIAIQCLRERDWPRLYPLCSSRYRRDRSFEQFLAQNREQAPGWKLGPCLLDRSRTDIRQAHAVVAFETTLVFAPESGAEPIPRLLLATFVREDEAWRLDDVASGPLSAPASPAGPAPAPPPPPPQSPP